MKSLLSLFRRGRSSPIPPGFHDYQLDELANSFGISEALAAQVQHDYRALLDGKPGFTQSIPARDLHALSIAARTRFGCGKKEAAAIARWFGDLNMIMANRNRVAQLSITEQAWVSACHFGGPGRHPHHIEHEGKRFDAQTGLRIGQEQLFPGALIGCICHARSVIPGFEDDED